jgi:predicted transcriptional regulator
MIFCYIVGKIAIVARTPDARERQGVELASHRPMSPKKLLPLTPTEWRLMRCVWDLRAANPPQIAGHLRSAFGEEVGPKTVGIFLARLAKKGYLRSAPGTAVRGRPPHIYFPLVDYEDALRQQLEKFLEDHLIDDQGRAALEALLGRSRDQKKISG